MVFDHQIRIENVFESENGRRLTEHVQVLGLNRWVGRKGVIRLSCFPVD
jgi:hypothetical protein